MSSGPKVAVLLSGCGFKDGAEIRESVFALAALDQAGAEVEIFSLNKEFDEVDHITGNPTGARRNMLVEAARIARGNVKDLKGVDPSSFDAVVLPGGFGVALHFCSFGKDGADCSVDPEIEKFLTHFVEASKPIGAICIAPALIAKLFEKHGGCKVTIGTDAGTAEQIQKLGCVHENRATTDICFDADRKVVSTPAYMDGAARLVETRMGIEALVEKIVSLC